MLVACCFDKKNLTKNNLKGEDSFWLTVVGYTVIEGFPSSINVLKIVRGSSRHCPQASLI